MMNNLMRPEVAELLQQLQQNREAFDHALYPLKNTDYTKLSTATFVDTTLTVRYEVQTNHDHDQLRNLCELNGDESGLFVYSYEAGFHEKAYRESVKYGTEYHNPEPDDFWHTPAMKKFKKFDFQTKKLFKVLELTRTANVQHIYCIASKYGYVAVHNSYGDVKVFHEASGYTRVEGSFKPSYDPANNVSFGILKKPDGGDQVVLLISKNGGEILLYDLNQKGNRHVSRLRQRIYLESNVNHSAFGFFESGIYLMGAPDSAEGPIIIQMDDDDGMFTLLDNSLTFPRKTSAMMGAWQTQGPLVAMATEDGECVVWHFPSRERVKVLLNCAKKVKALEKAEARRQRGETALDPNNDDTGPEESLYSPAYKPYYYLHKSVRIAKFNPVPLFNYILVYAEAKYFVHIVDTRTWDEQLIQTDQDINGLCFSSDGRKLYVAYEKEIVAYELILRTSLLETCLHYIRANVAKKEEYGWNLEAVPSELQRKMNY